MSDRAFVGWGRFLLWHALRAAWWPVSTVLFRPQVTGVASLPRDQGYLLLGNHTSTLDTLWIAAPLGRPVHFMTSADLMRGPVARRILEAVNCFAKTVGVRDDAALEAVKTRYEADQIVQIMPEGVRTWDGRLQPIRPGIGKLVKALNARVVLATTQTGHLCWPRWAALPRWVPLRIDYSPVLMWSEDVEPEQIWQEIVAGLTPTLAPLEAARTWGMRLADGLSAYLWACPHCFAIGGAQVDPSDQDRFQCRQCTAAWRLSIDNQLTTESPIAADTTVADAYDAIRAHFGDPPLQDRDAHARDGTILRGDDVERIEIPRGAGPRSLGRGPLRLTETGLVADDGWILLFSDVKAVNMDAGNVVHLRTAHALYRLVPHDDGVPFLWENFLVPWWRQQR